ncbi:MAG TPA: mannose-1-phosphate guanylyltransferase [Bryobacteraceae bacterium]|nr:mannose-1-phosphate guanylyltransferase [Bryobacteraceae bacterium]HYW46845.1 mannose-1-phosphate guanylyltransferase [Bryobacteraceae bacterium]
MPKTYGLILAGGRGTRFWPRSRRRTAKQVLRLFGDRSLIQQTVARLTPVIPPERLFVLTNDHLRDEIVRQLPEVPRRQILAEPAQRNTAPAIGLAAHILQSIDKDALMGVFPSDHVIAKPRDYARLVKAAFRSAAQGNIVVLGIQPRWPETGYGYIEFPKTSPIRAGIAAPVRRFREKPESPVARRYVAAGNFYWNAGMFFWKASVLLDALRMYLPRTASLLATLPAFTSRTFAAKLAEVFPLCENISIDYAVLERASLEGRPPVVGIPAGDIGWNDVGSWNAVYELEARDSHGNALRSRTLIEASSGNYVDANKKLVALLGVNDLIVVDTPDALLIADRSRAQEVGELVKRIELAGHEHLL